MTDDCRGVSREQPGNVFLRQVPHVDAAGSCSVAPWQGRSNCGSLYRRQAAGIDVVDVPGHEDVCGEERAFADAPHVVAHTVLEVAKGQEVDVGGVRAGISRELASEIVV